IVFTGTQQYVFGGIASNGRVYKDDASTELTSSNVATAMPDFHGTLRPKLLGSADELPDYTSPGASQQLFDFGAFRDAAASGKGTYFTSLSAFATAMNSANAAGKPLEGVIFVT